MACKPVGIKDDVLTDLATRFLINIPDEDKDDPVKLCSHIEVAYWFYLDLIRPEDPTLPGCSMKEFMATIFKHCPFLVRGSVARDLDALQTEWKSHKYRKPTRGAIILNHDLTKCLLVQGYPSSTSWGFPKGKLERGESDKDCAIREVYEETGFDIRALIQSEQYLECQSQDSERPSRMYIIPHVPEETEFKPRVRKEIRDIAWFCVDDLPRHKKDLTTRQNLGKNPSSFFMIIPFISQLKKWISSYQKRSSNKKAGRSVSATFHNPTTLQQKRTTSSPVVGGHTNPHSSSQSVPQRVVSGPAGMRSGPQVGAPVTYHGLGVQYPTVQYHVPLPPPAKFPPTAPLRAHFGYPLSSPHTLPPHNYHRPPVHTQTLPTQTVVHTHTPIARRFSLLPTPHSPHLHTSATPAQYVPHPTSVFNPVVPTTVHQSNSNSKPTAFVTTAPPVTTFNPFAALGINTTAPSSKDTLHPQPVYTPYQWNGNGTTFRPVQVHLQPAQAFVRFQFDKTCILSTTCT